VTEDTRTRIRACVERHPGLHFSAIVRRMDLAPGQVQYHLRRLLERGDEVREALYGRTHYYPPDVDPWERGALALARRETARDVLIDLLEHGPSRPADVTDRLGIARSTLEWHLDHLVEREVVRKRRGSDGRVTLALERPGTTVALLAAADPSLPERMVDRFERLLDRLLSDRRDDG